jgi:hypothetical protein
VDEGAVADEIHGLGVLTVHFQEILISGVTVEDEGYLIFNASSEWADKTTYLCNESEDGTWLYYLESIDECIGEMQRRVMFEVQKGSSSSSNKKHTSELSHLLTPELFEKAYVKFIEQADKNAISKKSEGSKVPFGFSGQNTFDGANFTQHFGQESSSKTPYINWWVVSIYYIIYTGRIIMGIEEDRYPHLNKMKPLSFKQIGNKKINIAVFYEASKNNVKYGVGHTLKYFTLFSSDKT